MDQPVKEGENITLDLVESGRFKQNSSTHEQLAASDMEYLSNVGHVDITMKQMPMNLMTMHGGITSLQNNTLL